MNKTQTSKLIDELPSEIDLLITMGCNVECPTLPCQYREDWGLDDPSGMGDEVMIETIKLISTKIIDLKERIEKQIIKIN